MDFAVTFVFVVISTCGFLQPHLCLWLFQCCGICSYICVCGCFSVVVFAVTFVSVVSSSYVILVLKTTDAVRLVLKTSVEVISEDIILPLYIGYYAYMYVHLYVESTQVF